MLRFSTTLRRVGALAVTHAQRGATAPVVRAVRALATETPREEDKIRKAKPRRIVEEVIPSPPPLSAQPNLQRASAYSTAEQYDLQRLRNDLDPSFYVSMTLFQDLALYCSLQGGGSAFFFGDGTLVLWGVTAAQKDRCMSDLQAAQLFPYEKEFVESEDMTFIKTRDEGPSTLKGDTIVLHESKDSAETVRDMLAFSNGLARSAKLAVLETQLDQYLEKNRMLPRLMREGRRLPMSREETLKHVGELLSFRASLNLHSGILETHDFYWPESRLENILLSTSRTLDVSNRISILNKKLDYTSQLVEVLRDHLSEKHGLKLEWYIIGLIAVEVLFEVAHYADRLGFIELTKVVS